MIQHLLSRDVVAVMVSVVSAGLVAAGESGVWVGSHLSVESQASYARKVSIRRDGGPQVDQVQSVHRLGVNCWAESEVSVVSLATLAQRAILESADGVTVLGAECISSAVIVPDESASKHVYLTFEVTLSGI